MAVAELPNTVETKLRLLLPSGLVKELAVVENDLKVIHVDSPSKSSFSQKKKQCDLWEYVWGSSLLLSAFLSTFDLNEISVLEIGGGHGLCSVVAAKHGAQVLMTDLVLDATKVCEMTAKANCVDMSKIEYAKLNWENLETVPEEKFDIVIGADVLFFRGCVRHVARTINKALKPGGVALVTDPCRVNDGDFVEEIEELGFTAENYFFQDDLIEAYQKQFVSTDFVKMSKAKFIICHKPLLNSNSSADTEGNEKMVSIKNLIADRLKYFVNLKL